VLEAEAGRSGLGDLFRRGRYEYIVNCIGVLKADIDDQSSSSVERAVRVNALFPHEVAAVAADHGANVVHVSTDAVFSGRRPTPYLESDPPDPVDSYGMSKALGESRESHVVNVRCSVVGRDARRRGLFEWYLGAQGSAVAGFVDYVWTPVTTVQFADWCVGVVDGGFERERASGPIVHLAPNPALSKADFLEHVRAHMRSGPAIDRQSSPSGACSRILGSRRRAPGAHAWPDVIADVLSEFTSRRD
jgi:dTDP-4-dehydrorhamnose reductase